MLLEELSFCCGPSGIEKATREYLENILKEHNIPCFTDGLGSLIAHNEGNKSGGAAIIFAPMDESGFIVSSIEKDGFIRFKISGDIDPSCLIAKTVRIIPSGICGVIGSKLFAKIKEDVFGKAVDPDDLYIDIGSADEEDAKNRVHIGDRILFEAPYKTLGENRIKMRSADVKAACAILIDLLEKKPDVDFYVCFCSLTTFSICGEKAFLGGLSAARRIHPTHGILLTGIEAKDTPGHEKHAMTAALGEGIALRRWNGLYVFNQQTVNHAEALAKKKKIAVQFPRENEKPEFCGASALTSVDRGIDFLELSIPCRYQNTPVATVDKRDIRSGADFIYYLITEFDWRI